MDYKFSYYFLRLLQGVLLLTASCIKSRILNKLKFKKNTTDKRLDININKPRNLKKQLMQILYIIVAMYF